MAFVQRETWNAPPPGRAFASGWPFSSNGVSTRRAAACLFSILVHCFLIWFLIARLADGTAAYPRAKQDVLALFNLATPGASESDPAASLQAAIAAPAASPAVVDLTEPTDLPAPEWSMARMPAQLSPSAPQQATATAGSPGGEGSGGARLSQFVGFGDGIGGEMLLDKAMLEMARQAAIRGFPDSRGTALIFLRVSPTGMVTGALVKGGSRDIGLALRRELIGKKLFLVRSAIAESALVALPPISLKA
jgi:hypothetical protein